jgi:hypothetical protein
MRGEKDSLLLIRKLNGDDNFVDKVFKAHLFKNNGYMES